jgi:hypothetical protein
MKKFFYGVAVLLSVSLFLTGCPTDVSDGKPGTSPTPSGSASGSDVTADDLKVYFDLWDVVVLPSGVATVYGEVPSKGTLIVAGATTKVKVGESLDVAGTLSLREGAVLDAGYIAGDSGYLEGAGKVSGAGVVKLPFLGANGGLPEGALSYVSPSIEAQAAVGSYRYMVLSTDFALIREGKIQERHDNIY